MSNREQYFYKGLLYIWIHEPQNEYSERHISIASGAYMINRDDSILILQGKRDKFVGHGHAGLITVIAEGNHIVTACATSKDEVRKCLEKE